MNAKPDMNATKWLIVMIHRCLILASAKLDLLAMGNNAMVRIGINALKSVVILKMTVLRLVLEIIWALFPAVFISILCSTVLLNALLFTV